MKPSLKSLSVAAALAWCCISPAQATGIMMPKAPGIPPLAIKTHRVKVVVSDQVALTQVEQVFVNSTDQNLEAIFVFPLPAGASVSEFAMMMNGKRVTGEVLEKNRAREIYTDIVRRMRDPGLLEYLGSNLFKASVFPIPARGEQKVELSYSEVIKSDGGLAEYVFPLKTSEQASVTLSDFSVAVELNSKIAIKNVYSPTHTIDVARKTDNKALASFEEPKGALDRDFRLYYTLSEKDFGLNLIAHRPKDSDGYFLMMVAPKTDLKEEEILPKDVCFVLDTSGSMSGPKMEQARKALQYCVNSLGKNDRFNIVRFSTDVDIFKNELTAVSKESIEQATEFIAKLEARGGTDINWALEKALSMKSNENRPYLIVFMTDGLPTIGTTEPKTILENVKGKNQANIRIFSFGVGNDVNTHLLDQIAGQTRATSQYVAPEEDIEVKVSSFYDKVNAPVLSNLKVDWGDTDSYDFYPKALPDLFKGSQLLVLGRYKKDGHFAIKLAGTINGKEETFVYEGTFAKEELKNEFIPKLWGSRKVGYLLDEIRLKGEIPELVQEVIALSKEHGIMTPYTSYLVTEDTPQRQAAAQPVGAPLPKPQATARREGRAAGPGAFTGRSDTDADDGAQLQNYAIFNSADEDKRSLKTRTLGAAAAGKKEGTATGVVGGIAGSGAPESGGGGWTPGSAPVAASDEAGPPVLMQELEPIQASEKAGKALDTTLDITGGGVSGVLHLNENETAEASKLTATTTNGGIEIITAGGAAITVRRHDAVSGEKAVKTSEALRELKETAVVYDARTEEAGRRALRTAAAAGRKFFFYKAVWIDLAWKPENKAVAVKYLSEAYFKLLERSPELKKVFSLGERVLVVLESGKAVLVDEGGKEDLTDDELNELLPKK